MLLHAKGIKKYELVDTETEYADFIQGRIIFSKGLTRSPTKLLNTLFEYQCLGHFYHAFTNQFYTKLLLAKWLFEQNTFTQTK